MQDYSNDDDDDEANIQQALLRPEDFGEIQEAHESGALEDEPLRSRSAIPDLDESGPGPGSPIASNPPGDSFSKQSSRVHRSISLTGLNKSASMKSTSMKHNSMYQPPQSGFAFLEQLPSPRGAVDGLDGPAQPPASRSLRRSATTLGREQAREMGWEAGESGPVDTYESMHTFKPAYSMQPTMSSPSPWLHSARSGPQPGVRRRAHTHNQYSRVNMRYRDTHTALPTINQHEDETSRPSSSTISNNPHKSINAAKTFADAGERVIQGEGGPGTSTGTFLDHVPLYSSSNEPRQLHTFDSFIDQLERGEGDHDRQYPSLASVQSVAAYSASGRPDSSLITELLKHDSFDHDTHVAPVIDEGHVNDNSEVWRVFGTVLANDKHRNLNDNAVSRGLLLQRLWRAFEVMFTLVFMVIAAKMSNDDPVKIFGCLPVWHWAIFLSLIFPGVALSYGLVDGLQRFLDTQFFSHVKNSTYVMVGLATPFRHLLLVAFFELAFTFMLSNYVWLDHKSQSCGPNMTFAYVLFRRLASCTTVFFASEFLKTLTCRLLAFRIHADTHFDKLQEDLEKEFLLAKLITKRWQSRPIDEVANAMGLDKETTSRYMNMLYRHLNDTTKPSTSFTNHIQRIIEQYEDEDKGSNPDPGAAGFYVWWNCRAELDSVELHLEDFRQFFDSDVLTQRAFDLFDVNGDGSVSYQEVVEHVTELFQYRRNLAYTLMDTRSVVGMLEVVVGILLHTLACFVYLKIFGKDVWAVLLSLSSVLLAMTFIFGNSVEKLYESIVFLFLVHPYDVGDHILYKGDKHMVDELGLMTTVLTHWNGQRVWVPNATMIVSDITNISRSGNFSERILFEIDLNTPSVVVAEIKDRLGSVIAHNAHHFTGKMYTYSNQITNPLKIVIGVHVEYNFSQQNHLNLVAAQSCVNSAVSRVLKKYKATHTASRIPTQHYVNYNQSQYQKGDHTGSPRWTDYDSDEKDTAREAE